MSDTVDIVHDLPLRLAALEGAHRHASPSPRSADTALPLPGPVVQPMMLVRYRPGVAGQTARAVHLVPMPDGRIADTVGTLCGALLGLEEIETLNCGQGMPCMTCALHQASATAPVVEPPVGSPDSEGTGLIHGDAYQAWGWPVTQHRDQIWLSVDCDVSAIEVPIRLSAEVTQILIERHCAPAVLAHPYAPEHHLILSGERFGVALPWPPSVQQVTGALMLPPTMTPRGPITWVQPPCQDSLHFSREIDVFSALHTVLSDSHR
ncbi:MAG: hypothetical protein QOE58_2583 [Actinomycetota bacterium]|nr:hypothetical protein [Actinomycetota bacterium]